MSRIKYIMVETHKTKKTSTAECQMGFGIPIMFIVYVHIIFVSHNNRCFQAIQVTYL